MSRKVISVLGVAVLLATLLVAVVPVSAGSVKGTIGVNVVLNTDITDPILAQLGAYGNVRDVLYEVDAVTMQAKADQLPAISALPYVAAANPDAARNGAPVDTVAVMDFANGLSTWDMDAINVTDFGFNNREVAYDGSGVYVAVVDTGLLSTWRQYFPQQRIATEYAKAFGGGGGDAGWVSSQPNKWERDTNSHGTHVTSTILGYSLHGTPINGVAPMATVIPVKVLNQNGSGWSSVVARGITYVADLKAGPLAGYPVVINMSLGGPDAGRDGEGGHRLRDFQGRDHRGFGRQQRRAGMGYPGAYAPVISVAASGWTGEWTPVGNRTGGGTGRG